MRLSHILYKVDDLDQAVREFTELGFTVVYGSDPKKATNALIWFEEGPFLELFTMNVNPIIYNIISFVLRLLGKKSLLKRVELYQTSPVGFCDVSIETDDRNLDKDVQFLLDRGYTCDRMNSKRTNHKGKKLNWQLAVTPHTNIPFLMSAYNIKQHPEKITHRNGALSIKEVVFGTSREHLSLLNELIEDERFILIEGNGLVDMKINGWDHSLLHPNIEK